MSPAQSPIRDASRMIARLSIQCQFYLCILEDTFSRYLDSTVYIQKTTKKTNTTESEVHVSARRVYGEQVYGLLQKDRCMILRHIRC